MNGYFRMSQTKTLKTKERILQLSLQLFNERGERSVTTNHIAAELNMSPGNLYYHFRNKSEIIKKLMEQYQGETLQMLALPDDRLLDANDKIRYFQVLSSQLWAYRFLHRDVYHLVENNEDSNLYNNLKSDFYLVGKRDVFSYSEPESFSEFKDDKYIYSLPSFVDMNISAEYRYNQKVSAFIQFNNFTAKKYQYWQNFPVQSIKILGGITISF